jgi:acetylornithine deacetylase/succinyl-diaminopimelate desuccinylase-like protein
MEFIEACKKLIGIDSSTGNGTGEAALFIQSVATSLGFDVTVQDEIQKGAEEANVICTLGPKPDKVHLMLQTHLDTVDPGSFALWNHTGQNPFQATIHDNTLYGLGASDTKLDFLCKLFAASSFVGRNPTKSFAVVGTYGEEYNMNGAIRLIRHSLQAERVLVGEPTHFNLATAGKGLANVEITIPFSLEELAAKASHDSGEGLSTQCKIFRGRPAHSSQPLKGENAIEKMIQYLEQLPSQILILEVDGGTNYNTIPVQSLVEFDLVNLQGQTVNQKLLQIYDKVKSMKRDFDSVQDPQFDPPMTTFNIGMVRTYSDHMKIMGCVRWPPAVKEITSMQWMDDLKMFCHSMGCIFRVRDYKKPFSESKESAFVKDCLKVIQEHHPESQIVSQPVTNEANVFHKLGLETLVFGPGLREGNSQTPEESIPIENLHKATKIYEGIIQKICFE